MKAAGFSSACRPKYSIPPTLWSARRIMVFTSALSLFFAPRPLPAAGGRVSFCDGIGLYPFSLYRTLIWCANRDERIPAIEALRGLLSHLDGSPITQRRRRVLRTEVFLGRRSERDFLISNPDRKRCDITLVAAGSMRCNG